MAASVNRRGVDPLDPAGHGVADAPDRIPVVRRAPAEPPAAAAGRPGAEADPAELQTGPTQRGPRYQRHQLTPCPPSATYTGAVAMPYRHAPAGGRSWKKSDTSPLWIVAVACPTSPRCSASRTGPRTRYGPSGRSAVAKKTRCRLPD